MSKSKGIQLYLFILYSNTSQKFGIIKILLFLQDVSYALILIYI